MVPIRLLLLDDHVLLRESLSRLLSSEPDFELVGHCGALHEALDILAQHPVDLVLLDFELEHGQGIGLITAAKNQGFDGKFLMVTAGMNAAESSQALRLGASGIFLKHSAPLSLAQAIRSVAGGGSWIDQKLIHQMAEGMAPRPRQSAQKELTVREQQVLRCVFEGLANKEIADRLGVSESSVKAALQQLFNKAGVRTRGQLVRVAIERGMETTDPGK
jgi:DNA-binding NarL/FixJ family response regulator